MITHTEFETKTGGRFDAVDITGEVHDLVRSSGVSTGTALVFSPHTTCCVLIASEAERTAEAARILRALRETNRNFSGPP